MTPQEQQIWDMVHKFCEDLSINIPDMNRRYLMDKIQEYGNSQWNAAIDAAAESAEVVEEFWDAIPFVDTQSILKLKKL